MSVEYTIICDGCAHVLGASQLGAWDIRAQLTRDGVQTAVGKHKGVGRFDFCPKCVERKTVS